MKTSYSSLPISKMKDNGNDDDNDDNLSGIDNNYNRVVGVDTNTSINNSSSSSISSSNNNNSTTSHIGDVEGGTDYFVDEELGGESSVAGAAAAAQGKKKSKKKKKKKKKNNFPSNTDINYVDNDNNTNNGMDGNQISNINIGNVVVESTTNIDNIDSNSNSNSNSSNNNNNSSSSSNASSSSSTSSLGDGLCFPADSYSLLAIFSPVNKPLLFGYGCLVFFIQLILLILMVLQVVNKKWSSNDTGNPDADNNGTFLERVADFVPPNVSPIARGTQFVSFICYFLVADSTINDWVKSIELWPNAALATNNDKLWCMRFSSFCRFCQATTAIIVTFFLVVTSSTAIDIILNFTAVNLISNLDEVAFSNVKLGKYGPYFEKKAKEIETTPLPNCLQPTKLPYVRHWQSVSFIAIILFSFYGIIVHSQQSKDTWTTQKFGFVSIGFGADRSFNGCYEIDINSTASLDDLKRYKYTSLHYNEEQGSVQYCMDERRWILFKQNENVTDRCKNLISFPTSDDVIAKSSKTSSFDISSSLDETWFTATNTPIESSYFVEDADAALLIETCIQVNPGSTIPTEIGFASKMTELSYYGGLGLAGITGTIPTEIGLLTELTTLILYDNDINGTIPSEIGMLTKLTSLGLTFNDNTGTIPSEIGMLTKLTSLDLGRFDLWSNVLNGTIPSEIGMLTKLTYLSLRYNDITGTIPSEIGWLTKLVNLYLGNNDFTGIIPSEIGMLTKLTSLNLESNKLTGSIPSEVDKVTGLEKFFNIDGNLLTGTLPKQIELFVELDKQFCKVCSEGLIPESTTTNFTLKGNFSCTDMFNTHTNNLLFNKDTDFIDDNEFLTMDQCASFKKKCVNCVDQKKDLILS